MSTTTNIDLYMQELEDSKVEIKRAIIAKGVTPTGGLSSYAEAVKRIPTGGNSKMLPLSETITENGEYNFNPIDDGVEGYNRVSITVDTPTYTSEEKSVTITKNGTQSITPSAGYDGLSKVDVTVNVASSGGDKMQIPNGFRFTGGDLAQVDFGAYDWSMVYDTSNFLYGCSHSTGDWTNFNENFNGKFVDGSYAFYNLNMTSMPNIDMSHLCSAVGMFQGCKSLESVPDLDLSNIIDLEDWTTTQGCNFMFCNCTSLKTVGRLNTPAVRDIRSMFKSCPITSIPDMNFDNVLNMESSFERTKVAGDYNLNLPKCVQFVNAFREVKGEEALNMNIKFEEDPNAQIFKDASRTGVSMEHSFMGCTNLKSLNIAGRITGLVNICSKSGIETFRCDSDLSHITACYQTFTNCTNLKSISDLNLSSVKNFYNNNPSVYGWVYGCGSLESMGVIDCDSVTDISHIVPYNYGSALINLGGFRNLGKASSVAGTNGNYFLNSVPNLTYESVMNVLNLLYDRASAGLSVLTLKLHPNHLAMLSEDDIAGVTNKGWTLV